jgi:membrane protein YqaA with SNARE-associated domain
MKKWIRDAYTRGMEFADSKWGPWILLIGGIADGSFMPLPVTTIFLTLCLLNPRNVYKYAVFLISGILAGSAAAYLTGHFAWLDSNAQFTGLANFFINNFPGFSAESYQKIHSLFSGWGSWILFMATATPIPYGLFSVSAGVFNINLALFLIVTLAGHSVKYVLLGYLSRRMGSSVSRIVEFSFKPVAIIPAVLIVIVLLVLRVV